MDQTIEEMRSRLGEIDSEQKELHRSVGDNAFTPEQDEQFDALEAERSKLGTDIEAALAALEEEERAEAAAVIEAEERAKRVAEARKRFVPTRSVGGAKVTSEPEVYRRGGQQSYFRDLYRAQHTGSRDSVDRLVRNDKMVSEERALSTTDGAGGEFVPPLWMVQDYIRLARAARVIANRVAQHTLPGGTDSISLPKLATGTAVAEQASQNTAVQNTDATTSSVTANVATIAGQQTVSQQLLDQSPVNMDEILLADLAADYATKLDVFVISNNAANKRGLRFVAGINTITWTDANPTVAELYSKLGDGIQQIHTQRFLPPNEIFMHPRRWAWVISAADTTGRPLAIPAAQSPQNVLAAVGDVASEGFVGSMQGLPVFVDPNLPTTLGAGTNEDIIFTLKTSDVHLYEGSPRAESFRETKAAELSVLLRFYNYALIHSERYPKSISLITGTGLVAPVF